MFIEFKLKWVVGELVFDVMKCDEKSYNLIDIDIECFLILDRVFWIDIEINGVIFKVLLINEIRNFEWINICFFKEIVFKSDYIFDFVNNIGVIELFINVLLDMNEKVVKGVICICGFYFFFKMILDYLDEEVMDLEEGIKIIFNFLYYDIIFFLNGSYSMKKFIFFFIDKLLMVVKDYYMVINICLWNNCIIDFFVLGDFGIDWKWD